MNCYFYGCWNEAGHYLFYPGGGSVPYAARRPIENFVCVGQNRHLDGSLAPRRRVGGGLCYAAGVADVDKRCIGGECEEGQFLLHALSNGYTAISWWDRAQGDTRPGCNSTVLLEGTHTASEMIEAFVQNFPHVKARMNTAGVKLVDVTPELAK